MRTITTLALCTAFLWVGCSASRLAREGEIGSLTLELTLDDLSDGHGRVHQESPAQAYVDGVLVGDCSPGSPMVLRLPTGRHKVVLELSRAWESSGNAHWPVAVSGVERVVVLGPGSTQHLAFGRHNLKKRRIR